MITLIVKDGLGNQLFQYAAARALATSLNTTLKLDTTSYKHNKLREYSLSHFNVEAQLASQNERRFAKIRRRMAGALRKFGMSSKELVRQQEGFNFNPSFFSLPDNSTIEGYWQSEKYFISIEEKIRKEFTVKEPPNKTNEELLSMIQKVNAVSLHVRRGDYVADPEVNALHGVCSLAYYSLAIEYIRKEVENPHFYIFSDDMAWVKKQLIIPHSPVYYVDHTGQKDYDDLRLMYSCKHNIIANSSFSWWGAWLNSNKEKIVVAPKNWVKGRYHNPDLLPASWMQLEN